MLESKRETLRVENIDVWYGRTHAVRDASLVMLESEIVAVLGPNGAGKTSFLMAISALVASSQRRVFLHGFDVSKLPAHSVATFGIVLCPEGRGLFGSLTVEENLRLGMLRTRKPWRKSSQEVKEIYELFPVLKQRSNQRASTLSGGEQQMVALARGILAEPIVLMVDEPALGLSPTMVRKVFQILPAIAARGISVLLVEQNATAAASVADRIVLMHQGQLKETDGCWDDIIPALQTNSLST